MVSATLRDRVKWALAEAGYPDASVHGDEDDPSVTLGDDRGAVPDEVCWKAFRVAGCKWTPCYECWGIGEAIDGHVDCQYRMSLEDPIAVQSAATAAGKVTW